IVNHSPNQTTCRLSLETFQRQPFLLSEYAIFDNLVTYHIHQWAPLPPLDALAYQYLLAGNGLFIRAETRFFQVLIPATTCTVRGLPPLQPHFQLHTGRIPERLLAAALADARRARRPAGGLNEALYHFHHHGRAVQVR